jgi:hypothetical protein
MIVGVDVVALAVSTLVFAILIGLIYAVDRI